MCVGIYPALQSGFRTEVIFAWNTEPDLAWRIPLMVLWLLFTGAVGPDEGA